MDKHPNHELYENCLKLGTYYLQILIGASKTERAFYLQLTNNSLTFVRLLNERIVNLSIRPSPVMK